MSVEITNTPDEGVGVHRLEDILDVPERESLEEPIEDRYDRAGTTKLDAHTLAAENIDKELLHGDRDDPLHGEWLRLKLIECERLYCDLGPSEDGKFTIAQKRVRVYIVDSESGDLREAVIHQQIPYRSRTDADHNIDLREHYRTSLITSDDTPSRQFEINAFRPIDDDRGGEDE